MPGMGEIDQGEPSVAQRDRHTVGVPPGRRRRKQLDAGIVRPPVAHPCAHPQDRSTQRADWAARIIDDSRYPAHRQFSLRFTCGIDPTGSPTLIVCATETFTAREPSHTGYILTPAGVDSIRVPRIVDDIKRTLVHV